MSKITIFTDGSSRGNPGHGGWGAIIMINNFIALNQKEPQMPNDNKAKNCDNISVIELGGGEKHTTNNRMELMAAIGGVSVVQIDGEITVLSDSAYVINGISNWIHGWKRNNWRTSAKKDVLNKDLWMKLDECVAGKTIKWKHVAGHAGVPGNERCDQIATDFADGKDIKLYNGPLKGYFLTEADLRS